MLFSCRLPTRNKRLRRSYLRMLANTSVSNEDDDDNSSGDGGGLDDLEMADNTHCKFDFKSYKMIFVVNSESVLYRQNALRNAKQVR